MKTLDEVIKALTICKNPDINRNCKDCPMPDTQECIGVLMTDALQYLKWYKELADDSEAYAEWKENPPLTWEELQQMEGKPVWVETPDSIRRCRWMFVGEWFDEDEMRLFDMGNDYPDYVSKKGYESGRWQAYRKERK